MDIQFSNHQNYSIDTTLLIKSLEGFLVSYKIPESTKVSLALVDEKTMKDLARAFLAEDPPTVHNVLSFTESEMKSDDFQGDDDFLGEIVVCYQEAEKEAKEQGISTIAWIEELYLHGALHILGIHHS